MPPKLPALVKKVNPENFKDINVAETLDNFGINPVEEILKEMSYLHKPTDRITVYFKLLEYCTPKIKPREKEEEQQEPVAINPQNVEHLWQIANKAVHGKIE